MRAIEVQRNGETLAVVGAPNALMFSADISMCIEEEAATIDMRGMNDLGNGRQSHTSWLELAPLGLGDVLTFRFIETENVTAPVTDTASDSEEHIEAQAEYEEQLKTNPLTPRELELIQPNAALQLSVINGETITATLEGGREFLAFRTLWNQWSPERCRISLSSFSQSEALARSGAKEWFQGVMKIGEQCSVKIGA